MDKYDFDGFDDFDEDNSDQQNEKSRFSNAEKYLDDFENEEKDGFRVEVKKPKTKGKPSSSGKKRNQGGKFNKNLNSGSNDPDLDEIEEDIPTDREKDNNHDNIISSLSHQAGITVSQSLGIDPSVDSLALDEYDHIEVVEI